MTRYRRELSVLGALVFLLLVLAAIAPRFYSVENLRDVALANLPIAIAAIAMTLVILCGQIDISIGSQFAIASIAAGIFAKQGLPIPVVILATCVVGALMGGFNGALTAYLGIPSIVVTLATMIAFRDGLRWATEGTWVQGLPADFKWMGLDQSAGQATLIVIGVVLSAASIWVMRNLAAGRTVYATGSDPQSAQLAGINTGNVIFAVFVLMGVFTAFGAALNAMRFTDVPSNAGIGMELTVIAAVVVGGTSVSGGRGSVAGSLIGVALLGVLGPALTFLGVSVYWERAVQGLIILVAVASDAWEGRARSYARAA
jgi:ribose/xylose/arabinose/galactoside ABC-type transport system permease subunit